MRWKIAVIAVGVSLSGCFSPAPKSNYLAPTCAKTAINVNDVVAFGFQPEPGKIAVMRIFATWCPYCKTDLGRMAERFRSKAWSPETVQIFLLAYRNHDDNLGTFTEFRDHGLQEYGFPPGVVQVAYIDRSYADLEKTKSASGQLMFTDWKGVPFGLVFGKDGRLAFRGHFTMSDSYSDNHYKFITDLTHETCSN